jgi:hypothetical protein
MKKLTIVLTTLTIYLSAYGQHDIGLKVNGGLSYIGTKVKSNITNQKDYFRLSGQGGVFYNFTLPKNFMVGAELLFIQIEGKEYYEIPFADETGNLTGEYGIDNIWRHVSYIGIPLYFGYSIKKFTINLGFQTNFALISSAKEKGQATVNGQLHTFENKYSKLNIDSYDFGPRIGLLYGLTKRFSIEANYYYGVNNIRKAPFNDWKWKVQQLTVGLRFKIFNISGQKKEKRK